MRRKDRQITDPDQIETILQSADVCRLGLSDDGIAYIVPMHFGVGKEGSKLCLYFHSAPEGRKLDLIGKTGRASFEAEAGYQLAEDEKACEFSCYYQSVIGHGSISVLRGDEDKLRALRCIMEHYTEKADWEISPEMLHGVAAIRLEIGEMTAKAHCPPPK